VLERMLCPASLVGKLIGRDGVTIRELQLRTGTRIQVDQKAPGDEKPVTIEGPPSEVAEARALIEFTLAAESGSALPGDVFQTVECPQAVVGRIIGKARRAGGGERVECTRAVAAALAALRRAPL